MTFSTVPGVCTGDPQAIGKNAAWRLIPPLPLDFLVVDDARVGIRFARLQMPQDLSFNDTVDGSGARLSVVSDILCALSVSVVGGLRVLAGMSIAWWGRRSQPSATRRLP